MRLLQNPVFLLLGTGASLGLLMPLGHLAHGAGIDPFLWAASLSVVPGLCLAVAAAQENWGRSDLYVFGLISGSLAYVIPNAILFSAMPHIGSGLGGLMFALSPVATASLSLAFRVRPPSPGLLTAVALGCLGAVLIIAGRNALAMPEAPQWLLIALLMPLSLAVGNVYRTARWPEGASPTQIGAASNLLAGPPLLALSFGFGDFDPTSILANWQLALSQWLASLIMFSLFFRLQWIGGPTYLSQIGYVAAALSLALGALVFGETYPPLVWLGAAFILAGIGGVALDRTAARPR